MLLSLNKKKKELNMSGGYFDYKQYYIQDLIEQMEEVLVRLEKEPIDSYECDSLKK